MDEQLQENLEEVTTETQDQTQAQEQEQSTVSTSETVTTTTTAVVDVAEGFPDYSDSELHGLFAGLGVNLDYVPKNPYQAFTMACSLICAVVFLYWFIKFLYAVSRDIFK